MIFDCDAFLLQVYLREFASFTGEINLFQIGVIAVLYCAFAIHNTSVSETFRFDKISRNNDYHSHTEPIAHISIIYNQFRRL